MAFIVDKLHARRSLREWYDAWCYARRWNAQRCLNYLRIHLAEDRQWLASNHIASTLCERYLKMTGPDWASIQHVGAPYLRKELGLEPIYMPAAAATTSTAQQAKAPDAWLYTVEYPLPDGSVKQMKFAAIESNLDFQSDIKCIDKQPLRV